MEDGVPTLGEHSPDNLSRFSYDFAFTPDAPHPMLDRFFEVVFRGENDQAKRELPMLLQEFIGACLFGQATKIEKILLLLGPGGNGKSQFLTIARSLFPPGSVSALPPQSWGEQYLVHDLQGRLANFVDEVPAREISSGAVFKKIVSGQETHANRKFRDGILFSPICGHIFNANEAPGTTDTSEGFFRRVLMVPFMWKPGALEAEVDIGSKIASAEKRALVSWAIRGYARLVKQGMRYTEPTRVKQQSEAWRTQEDGVRMFLFAVYEQHADAVRFSMNDLYRMYTEWCDRTKHLSMGLHKWARRVRTTNLTIDDDARNERGFRWNHDVVRELRELMGSEAPEWGEAPLPGTGTYSLPGADRERRSRKN
jgi:P4 family phage/plasmid primase-like protien